MTNNMKIDMHCHVREGSLDSKVPVKEYISILQANGFDGMVITDHNTYNGYRRWKKEQDFSRSGSMTDKERLPFVVFKGVEYDTWDGGHFLVIMPTGVKLPVLELRGLPLALLIEIVHRHGGILGPAHPGGEKFMSFLNTKAYRRDPEVIARFDFIEGYNCCENGQSNARAANMAKRYKKPVTGGSDSHKLDCVGRAYTILPRRVETETELVGLIKEGAVLQTGGVPYLGTTKEKMGSMSHVLPYSFFIYNKLGAITRMRKRRHLLCH